MAEQSTTATIQAKQEEHERRLQKLEDNDRRHEENIKQLYGHQEGTKAYVTQILQKIDSLETKLFNALTNQQTAGSKERQGWQDLIKYIVGVTIGALIIYIFTGGE